MQKKTENCWGAAKNNNNKQNNSGGGVASSYHIIVDIIFGRVNLSEGHSNSMAPGRGNNDLKK